MHAERVVHAQDDAAESLLRHVAVEAGTQRFQVGPCRAHQQWRRPGSSGLKRHHYGTSEGWRLEAGNQRIQRAAAERGVADAGVLAIRAHIKAAAEDRARSEEHTSELQSQ